MGSNQEQAVSKILFLEASMDKKRILFVCTENSARSQMAEAFLRMYAGDTYEAYGAGLEPKPIPPLIIKVMSEVGIGVSQQRSKHLSDYIGKMWFEYVITVCPQTDKNCQTIIPGMGKRVHWTLDDPVKFEGMEEEKLNKFREIRGKVNNLVKDWITSPSQS
jgi:arsenate reductase